MLALGRLEETEVVTCLELGADDYVPLPSSSPVLMLRIYALLRLSGMTMPSPEIGGPLLSGELFISPLAGQVFLAGQQVALTPPEFRLLHLLIKNQGSIVGNQALELALGLNQAETNGADPVEKHISSLRRKQRDNTGAPRWISSDQGAGYLFVGPAPISETPRRVTAN